MTAETSVLLPWRPVRVGPDPVYPADGTWAEPDVDAAADGAARVRRRSRRPAARSARRARAHVLATLTRGALGRLAGRSRCPR